MRFNKQIEFVKQDDEERVATGILLVPDRVDEQGDFFRGEDIRREAYDYMRRLPEGDARVMFMHAVDASDNLTLVENEVLDEPQTIGDREFPTNTWKISVHAEDQETWELFKDEIIGGFSVGGDIFEVDRFTLETVPDDVHVPDDWPEEEEIRRPTDFVIEEFSSVDFPAVPLATVQVLKAMSKADDRLGASFEACREAMVERGHSEDNAERLCAVMHDEEPTIDQESMASICPPCAEKMEEMGIRELKLGTQFPDTFPFVGFADCVDKMSEEDNELMRAYMSKIEHDMTTEDNLDDVDDATLGEQIKALLSKLRADDSEESDEELPSLWPHGLELMKVGRTVSEPNLRQLMAAHDAIEAVISQEVDFRTNRFTDNRSFDFDLSEHEEKMSKRVTEEQADIVLDELDQFVEVHGEDADLRSFQGWVIEHDFADEVGPAELVALNVAIDDFHNEHELTPEMQTTISVERFREWLDDKTSSGLDLNLDTHMTDNEVRDNVRETLEEAVGEEDAEAVMELIAPHLDTETTDDGSEDGIESQLDELRDEFAERLSDIEDRVDKVASGEAGSTQVDAGGETNEDEVDEATAFKRSLVPEA